MKRIRRVFLGLGWLAALAAADDFWTESELRRIDEGLQVLNVTRADLGFQKRPIDDPFRLAVVNRVLDEPLSIGAETQGWVEAARNVNGWTLLFARAQRLLDLPGEARHEGAPPITLPEAISRRIPTDLQGPFATALSLLALARQRLPRFDAALLRKALLSQVEKPEQAPEAADLADDAFLKAAQEMNRRDLHDAASFAVAALQVLREAAGKCGAEWRGTTSVEVEGVGLVILSGVGDDLHTEEGATLLIDFGGDDTYLRGASADATKNRAVSLLIDLQGDDRYVGRHDFSCAGALGGIALQCDLAGNDLYDAGHVSLGAAILGVGALIDEAGDDTYRCRDFGCGAGAFGIGLLVDRAGNDLYHADLFGQGFASTWGCGVLVDHEGNDVYDAGGAHLHAPLYNDRFQSLSQGFSIGMRPDASGGIGVLVDLKGNDRYSGDIYGQGASYWYSLGILADADGNDTYVLGQYGQGSGIHLSAGILFDGAGQDLYYCMNGVGMGGAHDWSVGFLVDRAGDDYYCGSGGTQGGALTNSVAMLLDDGGNDGYSAVRIDGAQGSAMPARNTGGIGLLLDGGGRDLYSELTRDQGVWVKDLAGAGIDDPSQEAPPTGDPAQPHIGKEEAERKLLADCSTPGPDGSPVWDLDKLWKVCCEWEVGDNRVLMPIARERFVAFGAAALDRAFASLDAKDSLVRRAVEQTMRAFPAADVVPRLLDRTHDADLRVRRNSVAMIAALQAAEGLPRLTEMLTADPETRAGVLDALAALKSAPPAVADLLRSVKQIEGVNAVNCLAAVADEPALASLLRALSPDHPFLVRIAAQDKLAGLGAKAVPGLASVVLDASQPGMARRAALRALGLSKCADAVAPIRQCLGDADKWIRFSAYVAAGELVKGAPETGEQIRPLVEKARSQETEELLRRIR